MTTSVRRQYLPFALPDLDDTEQLQLREVLESGWITTGPKVREFELEFAGVVGARHALAVNSCTAAMHLALEAVGVQRGDEIITSPYTFATTAEVIRYFDARPVFVDVDRSSLNIDPQLIERAITPKTIAILPVHIAGLPADLDRIYVLARRNKLSVVEDAAHAFPSKLNGKAIGSTGDISCFSFYATKPITTGEGGMICTNNDAWAERCRMMALHGISKDAWRRYTAEGSWYYEIIAPGYKYNMTDVAAAMGLAQLKKANTMLSRRTKIAKAFNDAFCQIPQLQIPYNDTAHQHSWHLYMLRLNLETLTIDRGRFIEELKKRNIGTSVHFIPLHIHPYYRDLYGYKPEDFPVAYREYLREISLPIYSKMTDGDVRDVAEAVTDVATRFSR